MTLATLSPCVDDRTTLCLTLEDSLASFWIVPTPFDCHRSIDHQKFKSNLSRVHQTRMFEEKFSSSFFFLSFRPCPRPSRPIASLFCLCVCPATFGLDSLFRPRRRFCESRFLPCLLRFFSVFSTLFSALMIRDDFGKVNNTCSLVS